MAYRDVYFAVFDISAEKIVKLYEVGKHRKHDNSITKVYRKPNAFFSIYAELQELIGKANDALERLDRSYGKDERFVHFTRY